MRSSYRRRLRQVPNSPENTAQNFPGPLFSAFRATPAVAKQQAKTPEGLMHGLITDKNSGGIEILVGMAEKGDIDPKNIDIIDICDRFLKAIAAAPRENLRQSGKIIFHACVLLRMKAEALLITKLEDLDISTGDDFLDFDEDGGPVIYDSNDEAVGRQITLADLQKAIVRQARQRQSRHRRVTLEQLIESLREAERLEKQRLERQRQPKEEKSVIDLNDYHQIAGMDDILDLAHDEDIEDVIARVDQLLAGYLEEAFRLSLVDLIKMLNGKGDWVDAFLAVLFLSNAGKLILEQETFYGPLFIAKIQQPEPAPPSNVLSLFNQLEYSSTADKDFATENQP
jgi:segregation and condensation protein A